MSEYHRANELKWDHSAERWQSRYDLTAYERAFDFPESVLGACVVQLLSQASKRRGRALVLSSGDNLAVVALAGLGFKVWSTDISANQLAIAQEKISSVTTAINYVVCDAASVALHVDGSFDVIYFGGGAIVWYQNLRDVLGQCAQVSRSQSVLIIDDHHPFVDCIEASSAHRLYDYFDTEAHAYDATIKSPTLPKDHKQYQFHYTLGSILSLTIEAGFHLRHFAEIRETVLDGVKFPGDFLLVATKD